MMFARHQFELAKPTADGATTRDHIQLVLERTGEVPEDLVGPECPDGSEQIWADFLELHTTRGSTGFGAARITWRDIRDWQEVRGVKLTPFDVDQIVALDTLWLTEYAPKLKGKEDEAPRD